MESGKLIDLKRVLMDMGNKLVLEQGFKPLGSTLVRGVGRVCAAERCTDLIAALTEFINASQEAGDVLEELGLDWSMTPEQQASRARHPYNS